MNAKGRLTMGSPLDSDSQIPIDCDLGNGVNSIQGKKTPEASLAENTTDKITGSSRLTKPTKCNGHITKTTTKTENALQNGSCSGKSRNGIVRSIIEVENTDEIQNGMHSRAERTKLVPNVIGKISSPGRNKSNGHVVNCQCGGNYADMIKFRHLKHLNRNRETIPDEVLLNRDKPYSSKLDYFGVMMSYMIGVGNVVRFSQLCHQHGGGAFFIPYFLMLILEGIPLYCLELAVGQRFGRVSLIQAWTSLRPGLSGMGLAAIVQTTIVLFYYNVIVSWCLYYFVQSLRGSLIWEPCPSITRRNGTLNQTIVEPECRKAGPEKYFWYRKSLDVPDDINTSAGLNMFMYLMIFLAWTSAWLLAMRGIRRSSKAMWLIILLIITEFVIFFFFAVHLDGWAHGLALLFDVQKLDSLKNIKVWMDAAGQIFFSMGIGYGSNILFQSGNKYNNNLFSDALVCSLANSGTSVWASIIMFSFFGYSAHYKRKNCFAALRANDTHTISSFMFAMNIEGNATVEGLSAGTRNCSRVFFLDQLPKGMSLVFVGMTQAFGEMTGSTAVWASLFFLLIFLLGTSSVPGMVHIIVNAVLEFKFMAKTFSRQIICAVICIVFCIFNLLFVQSTGLYLLSIIDAASGFPLLVIGFCECVGICYFYGLERFSKDLEMMLGRKPGWKWKVCWKFISPVIILSVIVGGIVDMVQNQREYTAWDRDKGQTIELPYPAWANALYGVLVILPIICLFYPLFKHCLQSFSKSRTCQSNGGICKTLYERYCKHVSNHRRTGSYNVTTNLSASDYNCNYGTENDGVELEENVQRTSTVNNNNEGIERT